MDRIISQEIVTKRETRIGDRWGMETTTKTVTTNPDGSTTTVARVANDHTGCPICNSFNSCGCFGS